MAKLPVSTFAPVACVPEKFNVLSNNCWIQKEALIKEQEEQSKKASEMVRNSLLQGFKEANKMFDEIEKSKKDVPNLIQKEKIIEIVK